jgi:hypothetical protein
MKKAEPERESNTVQAKKTATDCDGGCRCFYEPSFMTALTELLSPPRAPPALLLFSAASPPHMRTHAVRSVAPQRPFSERLKYELVSIVRSPSTRLLTTCIVAPFSMMYRRVDWALRPSAGQRV